MRDRAIGAELRRAVVQRADGLCEYCLIHEADTAFGCHVDHIISLKHGGRTEPDNLALACVFCNRAKGSDIASVIDPAVPSAVVRLFHPRQDIWSDHFRLADDGVTVEAHTTVGEVTARLLGFNAAERLLEREALAAVGRYPSAAAARRMVAAG